MTNIRTNNFVSAAAFAMLVLAGLTSRVTAQTTYLVLANPDWNITLTDYGYSDFLLDNTPGFEGREYLSGEWGAAVAYQVSGGATVKPTWLEPNFSYPDWVTNSSFHVVRAIKQNAVLNADNLPVAQSTISNGQLEITIDYEMLDTVVGTPMGIAAKSAGVSASINSSRYVMKQTLTIKNISGSLITNLQLFQFLHGLQSQRGVYDDRSYSSIDPYNTFQYKYDVTLAGVDQWAVSAGSSNAGLEDYIGFHAANAPSGYEIGYYGIEGNGFDNHSVGKPSEGVHLSVEDNWQHAPYAARLGTDSFSPPQRWIGGAQRWDLLSLANNASIIRSVILGVRTGTQVPAGTGSMGGCNGGSGMPGGIDYDFAEVTSPGSCFGSFSKANDTELSERINAGEFANFSVPTIGNPAEVAAQLWKVEFSGTYPESADVNLTFAYDGSLLPAGFDETTLDIYHYDGAQWLVLGGAVDPVKHTISVNTATLGVFALGLHQVVNCQIDAGVAPAAGFGTVTGAGSYAQGSPVTLVAAPESGYVFYNWTEGGSEVSRSPSYTFTAATDQAFVANFIDVLNAKAISTSSSPSFGGTTSGDGAYALNASATVIATANPGYKFSKWTVGGVKVSNQNDKTPESYDFTVTANRALVAVFIPVYLVTVTCDPKFEIFSGEPFAAEADTPSGYQLGEKATMKITDGWPDLGYCFVNWTQNDVVVSTDSSFSFTVAGNRALVAHFALGHRIDLLADPKTAGTVFGGGVSPDGSTVSLWAEPMPGYLFTCWTESGTVVSSDAGYYFPSTANRSLVANFVTIPSPVSEAVPEGIVFKWPANATDWVLQESTDLVNWVDSDLSVRVPDVVGNENKITASDLGAGLFFRLTLPTPEVPAAPAVIASPAVVAPTQLTMVTGTSSGTVTGGWRVRPPAKTAPKKGVSLAGDKTKPHKK